MFLGNWNQAGFLAEGRHTRPLREILTRLKETYCSNIGYEVGIGSRGGAYRPSCHTGLWGAE